MLSLLVSLVSAAPYLGAIAPAGLGLGAYIRGPSGVLLMARWVRQLLVLRELLLMGRLVQLSLVLRELLLMGVYSRTERSDC